MAKKETYRSPKLVKYGSVRNLTGGSVLSLMNDAGGSLLGGMAMA